MQFYRPVTVSAGSRYLTFVIAVRFGVAGADGDSQAYRSIAHNRSAAGIILADEGKAGIGSLYRPFFFCPLLVFNFFFLFCLVGFPAHRHAGCRFGDSLRFIGIYPNHCYIDAVGFGMGHIRSLFADNRPGQDVVSQQPVIIRHGYPGLRFGYGVALHYGNANQSRVGTAGFRFQERGVHGFQHNTVCQECIAAVAHGYPGDALVPGRSRVNRNSRTACTYAHRFGRDPAGAFRLQIHRSGLSRVPSGRRQGAAALYRNILICFVRIVGHADGHSQKRRRNADHIAPALDRVGRFQRQIAVRSGQRSMVH